VLKKAIMYGFGAIALYLVVDYATGFGNDVNATAKGGSSLISAFQGKG
jgi:hypothetical protein